MLCVFLGPKQTIMSEVPTFKQQFQARSSGSRPISRAAIRDVRSALKP
jgi:hypothetical protein